MILILGGTTEGRTAIQVMEEGGKPYFYSTLGSSQAIDTRHAIRVTGGMNTDQLNAFCKEKQIRLLIDAAHPFASCLHKTVETVSLKLDIPVIRLERQYPVRDNQLTWCNSYDEAISKLQADRVRNLLAMTGVKTIEPLRSYWTGSPCWFRILNREDSIAIAHQAGFPMDRLVFFNEEEDEMVLLKKICPDAILTKESGESGFFNQKVEAARQYGIPVYVIARPALPDSFHLVHTAQNLRRSIERFAPEFFQLRSGYTTGACATAAAKAALLALLTSQVQEASSITLPSGEIITLPVALTEWDKDKGAAQCTVIKDAGDDPDVTNGCAIIAQVKAESINDLETPTPLITLQGGKGVGTVTLPGLGLEIGGPAINATPRKMITTELENVLKQYQSQSRLTVTITVPAGEELAKRTFNPKLGIVGGISIIGTSGIVRPFSTDAFIASIRKEAEVAKAIGCQTLVINSGAKSERFLKTYLEAHHSTPLSPQAFVHYGNFIGETLKIATVLQFSEVILGIMIGKAVKLAEGALDTHSRKVIMNKEFLKTLARQAGCSCQTISRIDAITLARELWQILPPADQKVFFPLLLQQCQQHCKPLLPTASLTLLLISEEGDIPVSRS